MTDKLAIFRDTGIGTRLSAAADRFAAEYVFSPDEGADHDPTDFERMLLLDMLAGLFADEEFSGILQEAARGMKAAGLDPEGVDLPRAAHG